ncbi:hypothetical protein [Aquimarina pacifica]|uniref:hypothetical protein n=1 Tax=Aquimarina pacifica TaxID=1296415 RepID=UPI0004B7E277|nr:hypothetical protein [Aquimarina pacifica]
MKKLQKVSTGKKLNLEKFQISKIESPRKIMGGKMMADTHTNTATKPPATATE